MSIIRLVKYAYSTYKLYRMDEKIRLLAELQGKRSLLSMALNSNYPNEQEFFDRLKSLSGTAKTNKDREAEKLLQKQIKNREKNVKLATAEH